MSIWDSIKKGLDDWGKAAQTTEYWYGLGRIEAKNGVHRKDVIDTLSLTPELRRAYDDGYNAGLNDRRSN